MELRLPRLKRREYEIAEQIEAKIGRYVGLLLGESNYHNATTADGRYVLWRDLPDELVIDCHEGGTRDLTEQWRYGRVMLRGITEPVQATTHIHSNGLRATTTNPAIFRAQLEKYFASDLMAAGMYRAA